jgi:plasmid maintenance system antidote protein VapI
MRPLWTLALVAVIAPALCALAGDEIKTIDLGADAAKRLLADVQRLSARIALRLEQRFGRLAELGLDYGIEPDGTLWLLEANAQPGRRAFEGDPEAARLASLRPIQYASLLANRFRPVYPVLASLCSDAPARLKLMSESNRRYIQEVHP